MNINVLEVLTEEEYERKSKRRKPGRRLDDLGPVTSERRDDWPTPPEFLHHVYRFGDVALDPCPSRMGVVVAKEYSWLDEGRDGLSDDWASVVRRVGGGCVFVNPPYSDSVSWLSKCEVEAKKGIDILTLVPARTDTRWFHSLTATRACFVKGRIKFMGATAGARFPSVVLYWGAHGGHFHQTFNRIGRVVELGLSLD